MTETDNSNSVSYATRVMISEDGKQFREDVYARVASALAAKWPTRDEGDYNEIARCTSRLTAALVKQYQSDFTRGER